MIYPEYVIQILEGRKTVEYRTWATKYRGDFFVGCTATKETRGFLAAVVSLDDVTFNEKEDVYEWHISNVRAIKPLPINGRQRLFETGIDEYEVIPPDMPAKEVEAIWNEADSWLLKTK